MARPPAWICPQCDERCDPRFHECQDLALDTEPPAPRTTDAQRPDDSRWRLRQAIA